MINTKVMHPCDMFLVPNGSLPDGRNLYNLVLYTGGRNQVQASYVAIDGLDPRKDSLGVVELFVNLTGAYLPNRIIDVVDSQ